MVDFARINNTLGKMGYYLGTHNNVCVSVSGGSDSDIVLHIVCKYFRQYLHKVKFVFVNPGLEYRETLRHLDVLEEKYNITIDRIRGESVVSVIRKHGFPILSKNFSEIVGAAVNGAAWGIRSVARTKEESPKYALTPKQKLLAWYIIYNKIKVSDKCCKYSKKDPLHKYMRENKIDLDITGERKAEGGVRATAHKSCFESRDKKADKYMPLWFWDDETKQWYKEQEGIIYSNCYEVWGMKRTGCVGCPFDSRIGDELKTIKKYEPQLYKACMNVFGMSYELMDKFEVRKRKILGEGEQ